MYYHLNHIEKETGITRPNLYRMIYEGELKASFTPYGWYKINKEVGDQFIESKKVEKMNFLKQLRADHKKQSLAIACITHGRERVLQAFDVYGMMLYVRYYATAHNKRMRDIRENEHKVYERNIKRLHSLLLSDDEAAKRALQYALDFSLIADHDIADITAHVCSFCRMPTRTAFLTAHAGESPL